MPHVARCNVTKHNASESHSFEPIITQLVARFIVKGVYDDGFHRDEAAGLAMMIRYEL